MKYANRGVYRFCLWLAKRLRVQVLDEFAKESYSQEGEDMILGRYLEARKQGFYVDVGAHHPKRFSNTYMFYRKGWSGINIDAMPGSMELFKTLRPRDINIEMAVCKEPSLKTYYIFNESALNTFDEKLALSRVNEVYKIVDKKQVPCRTLSDLLSEYMPKDVSIDFMTIDVEGLDLAVLESNDWRRFRPNYLVVECIRLEMEEQKNQQQMKFLEDKGYRVVARCYNSVILESCKIER
jgi:FkbM family methyltransferase